VAAIVFTAGERDRLKVTLDGVKSNAQAQAAVKSVLNMADRLLPLLWNGGAYREQAAKDIAEYAKRVRDYGPQLAGSPTMPVGATWGTVKGHVSRLYYLVRTIEQGVPPGEDLGDGFGKAVKVSLDELPANIGAAAGVVAAVSKKVVNTAAKTVKEVAAGAAEIVGGTVWAALKPLLPVVLIAGVGVGIYFYVMKKGIPLPKGLS
jgi:hypothetical protein